MPDHDLAAALDACLSRPQHEILAGDVEALRGVSFQLAVDRGIASWKLAPVRL
jgi:hypothetical protein